MAIQNCKIHTYDYMYCGGSRSSLSFFSLLCCFPSTLVLSQVQSRCKCTRELEFGCTQCQEIGALPKNAIFFMKCLLIFYLNIFTIFLPISKFELQFAEFVQKLCFWPLRKKGLKLIIFLLHFVFNKGKILCS